ncbi:MAG: cob(I)yrinic acid a,c-diamide adenosyltransferase [Patescibacteria group bacterium]
MLYTRKGDNGTTKTFGCDQRISKSSIIAEALGSLDEINSFLGLCKVKAKKEKLSLGKIEVSQIVHDIQKNLFIIQAELAGASMSIDEEKVKEVEAIINSIEKELPPIKTFFISGGTELASIFDIARTISRRAERRVVAVSDEGKIEIKASTKAYLNRLSSALYAFARLANYKSGINEESPDYK